MDTVSFVAKGLSMIWLVEDWYDKLDEGDQNCVRALSVVVLVIIPAARFISKITGVR